MSRLMVVTVGTSLFQSASWDGSHQGFQNALGKTDWANYQKYWAVDRKNQGLRSPDFRRKNDNGLEEIFHSQLTAQNTKQWAEWLTPYDSLITPIMRYSAEIATILRFAEKESAMKSGMTWNACLNGYDICFIHDLDPKSYSHIAAQHNLAYLEKLIGSVSALSSDRKRANKSILNLSGNTPASLVEGLNEFQKFLLKAKAHRPYYEQIDIVITGGYKAYSMVGYGFLLQDRFRVIYQHEEFEDVVIQDKNTFISGEKEEPFVPIIP